MKYKKSSDQKGTGSNRGVGRAVAAMVMALAVAVGGGSTTALLLSQPTGLTVVPSAQQWEKEDSRLTGSFTVKKAEESEKAESEASSPAAEESETTAETEKQSVTETAAKPETKPQETVAEETPADPEPEAPAEETPAEPEQEPAADIEEENSFPFFQQETEALAAEDPLSAPVEQEEEPAEETTAADETNSMEESALEEAQITTEDGTILLTPEEIRDALDAGTLDETELETTCLDSENGFLKWLWQWFFGIGDDEDDAASDTPAASTPAAKPAEPVYSGWRTVNGKTYYYDQGSHQPVTGIRAIDNKLYYFDANGVQQNANFGIDVSKYQSNIDWNQVKQAGVNFVIIRIGYRGYGSGTLVQDPMFEQHFTNARNAGLKVGVYFFSQAVNENEAREEAQGCWRVLNGRGLDYPIYFDSEASGASNGGGRADGLGQADRTKCAIAFCEEVKALGYQPGVYASTLWFRKRLDLSQLTGYSIWNAHYNVASSPIACNMWQGSCTARISGYSGQLDVNISYMG